MAAEPSRHRCPLPRLAPRKCVITGTGLAGPGTAWGLARRRATILAA